MQSEPQKQHKWLEQMVGNWTMEGECIKGPGQPVSRSNGTESAHMLGGLWMVANGEGEMPGGGAAKMVMTLGYDPRKQRFVGTWFGSVMDLLFIYDGELDATGKVLTLSTEGPNFTDGGKMTKCQDIIEIVAPGHRTLTSRMLGQDGTWNQFMVAHYRRIA